MYIYIYLNTMISLMFDKTPRIPQALRIPQDPWNTLAYFELQSEYSMDSSGHVPSFVQPVPVAVRIYSH